MRIEAVPEAVLKQLVEVPRCLRWDASARAVHVGGAPGEGAWRIERDALSPLPRVGGQKSEVRLQLVAAWCALDTRAIHMERRWGDVTLPSGRLCAFRATEHVRIDPLAPDDGDATAASLLRWELSAAPEELGLPRPLAALCAKSLAWYVRETLESLASHLAANERP